MTRMMCCSAIACGCSRSPTSSATSRRPAGRWESRARLATPGAEARALRPRRAQGPASAAGRGRPTRSAPASSTGSWPSPSATRASGRGGSRPRWPDPSGAAIRISEHGVWRVLKRFNINTRSKRLVLIARHADPTSANPQRRRHSCTSTPRSPARKQMDCFFVGRLAGAKGVVWQYTATDVASAYTWAFLRETHLDPSARFTAELVHLVAAELKAAGWKLREVTTDNGSEFRAGQFGDAVEAQEATQRRIKAGTTGLERLRRANPAHHPRGVLATRVLALAGAEDHGAPARPRRIPPLRQQRPRPHRAADQRSGARDIVFGARRMATVR
jgi:hypothetical protein